MRKNYIIVADSSANLYRGDCADFTPVPLKIIASEKEYVDDESLDVAGMLAGLREYKGRSGSARSLPRRSVFWGSALWDGPAMRASWSRCTNAAEKSAPSASFGSVCGMVASQAERSASGIRRTPTPPSSLRRPFGRAIPTAISGSVSTAGCVPTMRKRAACWWALRADMREKGASFG